MLDGKEVGILGEIHPQAASNFGIDTRVYVAQLDGDALFETHSTEKKYHPLPKFPASTRDVAVTCDEELPVAEIEKVIRANTGRLLEKLELFDVYRGSQIPQGKKSVAYSLVLRAADRTLTVEECDRMMNNIFSGLESIGGEIRK